MRTSADILVGLWQARFDRSADDTSLAICELKRACELMDERKEAAAVIAKQRELISGDLGTRHDAGWLVGQWVFDRLLSEDHRKAREDVERAEVDLAGSREEFARQRTNLVAARAKLRAALNLQKRFRRAAARRRERRLEEEVSENRTRCL